MNKRIRTYLVKPGYWAAIAAMLVVLVFHFGSAGATSSAIDFGFVNHSYGTGVKAEPTGFDEESKLWWNDGFWWGILFDPATTQYAIHWFDWGEKTWVSTATAVDSRYEVTGGVPGSEVATRFDALWDAGTSKLYLASHIKVANASRVNSAENWARLYRYSYQASTDTYTLDTGFPVTVNRDKTTTLVLDKDSAGRLWVTYVSRVPDPDPLAPPVYNVYVNSTVTAGNDLVWGTPLNMTTFSLDGAAVKFDDISSVITYGNNVAVMWSNVLTGSFYYAEHPTSSAPDANWTVQPVTVSGVTLLANNHIKLLKDSSGQVFAAIKTLDSNPPDPQIGVLARDTNGIFTFHMFSDATSVDTRPTLVLNESNNTLYLFASSNEVGGAVCYKPLAVTSILANMQFTPGNCSENPQIGAAHFISSTVYANINNATTTKQNINDNTGLVVLASDDVNGKVYVHNTMGNPLPVVTGRNPARGGTLTTGASISAIFSHEMDAASLTPANFKVVGPNGAVSGTVSYNAATRTASFAISGQLVNNATYTVTLTNGVKDTLGRSLFNSGESWQVITNLTVPPTATATATLVPTATATPVPTATATSAPILTPTTAPAVQNLIYLPAIRKK